MNFLTNIKHAYGMKKKDLFIQEKGAMKYLPSKPAVAFWNMREDGACLLLRVMGQLDCVPNPTETLVFFES